SEAAVKKCDSEPSKPYEESVCGLAERVGVKACEQLPEDKAIECKRIVRDVSEGKVDGAEAKNIIVGKFGFETYFKIVDTIKKELSL
ncbi:MAG: hypothetical protein QXI37_03670, partial [Thermoprotei archaeon]